LTAIVQETLQDRRKFGPISNKAVVNSNIASSILLDPPTPATRNAASHATGTPR